MTAVGANIRQLCRIMNIERTNFRFNPLFTRVTASGNAALFTCHVASP